MINKTLKNIYSIFFDAKKEENQIFRKEIMVISVYDQLIRQLGDSNIDFSDKRNVGDLYYCIFKELNRNEIIKIMELLESYYKDIYDKISIMYDANKQKNSMNQMPSIGFETMIVNEYFTKINTAHESLDTGDFIAYLIGMKIEVIQLYNCSLFNLIKNKVLHQIHLNIIQSVALLQNEIEKKAFIPIKKALYIFFLKPKYEAVKIFKKIIQKDLSNRHEYLFDLEYQVIAGNLFNRLKMSHIPYIDSLSYDKDFILQSENFITKDEIFNIIDPKDIFNKRYPLDRLDDKYYINLRTDIKIDTDGNDPKLNIRYVSRCFYLFFQQIIDRDDLKFDSSFVKMFFSNITKSYSEYDIIDLKIVQDKIKKIFENESDRCRFFALIFQLKEYEFIQNISSKIPVILEEYFKGEEGYSHSTIKDHCINNRGNNKEEKYRREMKKWLIDNYKYLYLAVY